MLQQSNLTKSIHLGLVVLGIIAILGLQGCGDPKFAPAKDASKSVKATVEFGMQPAGGGPCGGGGVCSAAAPDASSVPAHGVAATFAYNPMVDKSVIIISFGLGELQTRDAAEAKFFSQYLSGTPMACPPVAPAPPADGGDAPPEDDPDARPAPPAPAPLPFMYKFGADFPLPKFICDSLGLAATAKIACTSPIIVTQNDDRITMYVRFYQ